MGIYTDLATSEPIGPQPQVGLDRSSGQQLLSKAAQADPDVLAAYAASNEQTVIPEQVNGTPALDTYTLSFTFYGALKDVPVTATGMIVLEAVDTVIEAAIDSALNGVVPGWTNGDVSVSMAGAAGLDDGSVTLDFDGASVAGTPVTVTLTPIGFVASGPITRTPGQTDRKALMALFELNVVEGTVHDSPNAPTDWVRPESNGQSRPRYQLIRDLARVASTEDGTDAVTDTVNALYPVV